jgi:hypothetical protein
MQGQHFLGKACNKMYVAVLPLGGLTHGDVRCSFSPTIPFSGCQQLQITCSQPQSLSA